MPGKLSAKLPRQPIAGIATERRVKRVRRWVAGGPGRRSLVAVGTKQVAAVRLAIAGDGEAGGVGLGGRGPALLLEGLLLQLGLLQLSLLQLLSLHVCLQLLRLHLLRPRMLPRHARVLSLHTHRHVVPRNYSFTSTQPAFASNQLRCERYRPEEAVES